jgi:hypothetical protein
MQRDKAEHKGAFLLIYQYKLERSGMRFEPFHGGNRGSNPLGRAILALAVPIWLPCADVPHFTRFLM